MNITEMTKKDFAAVPKLNLYKDWGKIAVNGHLNFNSIVVIPAENEDGSVILHDSGWGCMEFCLVDISNEPIGRIDVYTDVINLDGIGGYGDDWLDKVGHVPDSIPIHGWNMDLLPCGYLRIWARNGLFINNPLVGSNMELFAEDNKRMQK